MVLRLTHVDLIIPLPIALPGANVGIVLLGSMFDLRVMWSRGNECTLWQWVSSFRR